MVVVVVVSRLPPKPVSLALELSRTGQLGDLGSILMLKFIVLGDVLIFNSETGHCSLSCLIDSAVLMVPSAGDHITGVVRLQFPGLAWNSFNSLEEVGVTFDRSPLHTAPPGVVVVGGTPSISMDRGRVEGVCPAAKLDWFCWNGSGEQSQWEEFLRPGR